MLRGLARPSRMSALPAALLGFVAGTLALQWQPVLPARAPAWGAALALVLVAVLIRSLGRRTLARWGFALAVGVAAAGVGFALAAFRAEGRLADALPAAWEGQDIELIGVVDDLPAASPRSTRFAFAVERVLTEAAVVPARLALSWFPTLRDGASDVPALRAGERWHLTVRLRRPHGSINPHGFDFEAWLLVNAFRATGYVRPRHANARIDAFAGRPGDHVQRVREQVRERALAALGDSPYAGVIVALAIGEQRGIPESQWLVFNRTGITHLISISGLHVTVFAGIAAALALAPARRSVRLTRRVAAHRVAAVAGAVAAFAYVLLAGAGVPAQRTLIMVVVAAVGLWIGRPGTARMIWLWALVTVLAVDPWAGLTPGFWLSFGAVALLLYGSCGRLHSMPSSRKEVLRRGFVAAVRAQAIVTIGLVPLTLAVFQQVSLVAPLANALAIPVVTFIVVPLALLAIVVPVDLLWLAAHEVFAWLMVPLELLARLPGHTWEQHAPLPWTVASGLLGVLWLLAPRGVPLRSLGACWLLPLFVVREAPPEHGSFRMTVLDVGQGLAVVVETRSHALLYDAGPRYTEEADAGGRIVAPFLRGSGIRRLAALVVSHLDSDHSGGARTLLQTIPVDWTLTSVPGEHTLFAGHAAPDRCVAGQAWTWDGVRFTVLHPAPEDYARARTRSNDLSCVLRIEAEGGSALLPGDIEARAEAALLARAAPLHSDVIVVPHHGSRTSSSPDFVRAVSPGTAILAAGYRNRFGHPRAEVASRWRDIGAQLPRTDLDGAVIVTFGASGSSPQLAIARAQRRRYWHDPPVTLPEPEPPQAIGVGSPAALPRE